MAGVLVFNAGSSSIKFRLFGDDLAERASGGVFAIGGAATLDFGGRVATRPVPDHAAALDAIFASLGDAGFSVGGLTAAAHRVVHGGATLVRPCRVTPEIVARIEACVPLAPLHNPHNLAAIRAVALLAPGLPQTVSFDTGFHAANPPEATRYALPAPEEARGIRRYGFHGISYESLVRRLPDLTGAGLPRRLLAFHLGNGASLCAIREGRSVATTMGYSPLAGLTMGTRTGDIDGNAVLDLAARHGVDGASRILNRESGLLALGGHSDMRALRAAGTPEAGFAISHFTYWAVRHAGSMIAAMGGLDAVAFTGGIGENDAAMRADILDRLGWAGCACDPAANAAHALRLHPEGAAVAAWIVPAQEERLIAGDALRLLRAGPA